MDKKAEFKAFASLHPKLNDAVLNHQVTWQELYETYDIYGKDSKVWDKYLNNEPVDLTKIRDSLKNIDYDKLEDSINNAKKALGIISALIGSKTVDATVNTNNGNSVKADNINQVFED